MKRSLSQTNLFGRTIYKVLQTHPGISLVGFQRDTADMLLSCISLGLPKLNPKVTQGFGRRSCFFETSNWRMSASYESNSWRCSTSIPFQNSLETHGFSLEVTKWNVWLWTFRVQEGRIIYIFRNPSSKNNGASTCSVLVIVMMWCLFLCTIPYMEAQYRALKLPKSPKHIPGRKENKW